MEAVYAEAVSVLRLHFVNVGDGDCILVEQFCGPRIFRMLVDTGLEEAGQQGPACMSCVEYLRRHAVRHLDVLFITHLHFDHFGGLRALLREVRVDEAYSSYFPEMSARAPRRGVMQGKSVTGLLDALTRWQQDVEAMRALGCRLHTATGGMVLQPTDTLRIELPECGEPLRIVCFAGRMSRPSCCTGLRKRVILRHCACGFAMQAGAWSWARTVTARFGRSGKNLPVIF